jgi:enediyne biosynthesis protein E4
VSIFPRMSRSFNRRAFLRLGTLATAAPIFDVKLPRGLDFTLLNSPTPQKYLIETMPGGVALFDYIRHVTSPMLLPEKFDRANPRYWNRLYRQNKDSSFSDVTEAAGLSSAGAGNYGMGVAIGDYDNNGYADLFVTSYGKNVLYHNNGDGTFTNVTAKAGVAGDGWHVSEGFFDYDNDGHLDLFVTRYMEWDTRAATNPVAALGRLTVRAPIFRPAPIFSIGTAATARLQTSA